MRRDSSADDIVVHSTFPSRQIPYGLTTSAHRHAQSRYCQGQSARFAAGIEPACHRIAARLYLDEHLPAWRIDNSPRWDGALVNREFLAIR